MAGLVSRVVLFALIVILLLNPVTFCFVLLCFDFWDLSRIDFSFIFLFFFFFFFSFVLFFFFFFFFF